MRKRFNQIPRLTFPEVTGRIGRCGEDAGGEAIDVQVPDGSLVAVVGSDSFTGFGTPEGGDVIFGGGEEEVAVVIVFYEGYASFVAFK